MMFRDFVCRKARKLGVVGTVQNISDGSVLVVAQGEEERLQKLLLLLRRGSLLSKVDNTKDTWLDKQERLVGFNIVY